MHKIFVSSLGDLPKSRLAKIGDGASLADVAQLLCDAHISLVVVCDGAGAMVGVITKTDIVQQFGLRREGIITTMAADVMTQPVLSCRRGTSLHTLLAKMEKHGFVHVPVIDDKARPSGVVNAGDALRKLITDGNLEAAAMRNYVMGIGYR